MYDILEDVNEYDEFLTVEELNDELVNLLGEENVEDIGKSEEGHSILCGKIGNGNKNALLFGFPHPNEPIGSLSCLELIKILKDNENLRDEYTWYIIPCGDPDGAKLNEGWFKGEFTIKNYVYNYYRSKPSLQTDWNFPVEYKDFEYDSPPANTEALAKFIEKISPEIVYPIHNSGMSGAYFLVTEYFENGFYDKLQELCEHCSIPLDMGEPEASFFVEFEKPVYRALEMKDYYEFFKDNGLDPNESHKAGTTSIGFAKKTNPNLFGLLAEVPYVYDGKISDESKIEKTRRDNKKEGISYLEDQLQIFNEVLDKSDLNKESIFYELIKDVRKQIDRDIEISKKNLGKEEFDKKSTVSERFSDLIVSRFYMTLVLGEARRLLLESKQTEEIKNAIKNIEEEIDSSIDYIDNKSNYKVFPIKNMVQVQLGFLLLCLDYLND